MKNVYSLLKIFLSVLIFATVTQETAGQCGSSTAPTGVSGTNSICQGKSTTLSQTGGTLVSGATWQWYSSGCGTTSVGSGASITVTPVTTTTYYVRAEDGCGNTSCASITVTVNDTSITPTITGPSAVCEGSGQIKWKRSGGDLKGGNKWEWFRVACYGQTGNVWLGQGDSISFTSAQLGITTHGIYLTATGTNCPGVCAYKSTVIRDSSVSATSISGSSTICLGRSSTLNVNGGKLGSGATWKWYLNACGGTSIGTGSSFTVSPTSAGIYTYYVRAEGTCNTTICQSFTLTVRDTSIPPASINGSTTICLGQSTTLSTSGGSLGHGASWKWYEHFCGGSATVLSSLSSLTVSPTSTTNYWLSAEGTCNTTPCTLITVTVRDTSVPATAISGSSTICLGQTATLSPSGGRLGHGADWKWYLGSCSGTSIGSGSSFAASPTTAGSYTYYLRAEGTCNNTVCRSLTLTVRDTSIPATAISATTTNFCVGSSSTLTPVGGLLGHGANWQWTEGACTGSGTGRGSGSSLVFTPTGGGNYTYYLKASGTCNATVCVSILITVNDTTVPPGSISSSMGNPICLGQQTQLYGGAGPGILGTGASWKWYSGSCGGTLEYTGANFTVPNTPGTFTYYLRGENSCHTTVCRSYTITVRDSSVPASSIGFTTSTCLGVTNNLTVNGGSLGTAASWKWYTGSCGGTYVGTGSIYAASPSSPGTYTYYVRAEGTCNTTICKSVTYTVLDSAKPAISISGPTAACQSPNRLVFARQGGSLGSGGKWNWWRVGCGAPNPWLAVGDTLFVTTGALGTGTHNIYLVGNGCNTTKCILKTVVISDTAVPVNSITGTSTICQGSSTTLSVSGGALGLNGAWKWYSGSCGGVYIGTGSSIVVSPASTTTYFVRAESSCSTSICKSVTVTVRDTTVPPNAISAVNSIICQGQSTTLSITNGILGNGATWKWYSGSCGGTSVGTGTSVTVSPNTTTTYYIRGESTCKNSICRSYTITVRDTSVPATSASASSSTICEGQSTTLSVNGGTLGTGGSWKWYSGSCTGTPVATGSSVSVSPGSTTTYYVKAEGTCNNTVCRSVTVTVRDTSAPAVSLSSTSSTLCVGQSTTLSVNGGTLGTGGSWKWYRGSCGGTSVGTGSSVSVSPTTTTTYYARAEGTCNNTVCKNITITVRDTSVPATSASASSSTICEGQSTTLSVNGGTLGTGGSWKWYSGSCTGTPVATGSSVSVSPGSTTTYYVKAEGTCNNTVCRSVTVTVRDTSAPAVSLSSTSSTLCVGQSTTLSVNGGTLGTGGSWKWYRGSCGGTSVGTGSSVSVSPTATTTYYARAEGTCNNTVCQNITITVRDTSVPATSASASSSTICEGQSTTLSVSGGTLGTSASWKWYSGSCGGTLVTTGSSLSVSPTATTTYYVRAEGTCNNTSCKSVTITVRDTSVPVLSVNATKVNICVGTSTNLSINGGALGTGAAWKWYSGSCGGTYVGTGSSLSVSPTSSRTYYVRAEGTCNNTLCQNISITVSDTSVPATSATATSATICKGKSTTLSISGGALGTSATWRWYSGSCGGVSAGTGSTLTVSPAVTTTYYVRAEGTCNNSICRSITITVNDTSVPAISINSSGSSTFCLGGSRTLSVSGGSLGTSASWKWYTGSCGGTSAGTGSSLSLTPTTAGTYNYFVRAEGSCNNTVCRSYTMVVDDTSIIPTSINGPTSVCQRSAPLVYTVSGGKKGTGARWDWYRVACSGQTGSVWMGIGDTLKVTTNALGTGPHVLYVRADKGCNTTGCRSLTVVIRDTVKSANSITGTNTICAGKSTTLTVNGGSTGTGGSWKWYTGSCGGTSVATGSSVSLSPAVTTTYYARAENSCGNSPCVSYTVTVRDSSAPATSVSGTSSTICQGQSSTLSVIGGTLGNAATWKWYSGSCGGTSVGTGSSLTVNPTSTTTYYVRGEGTCNNTICRSYTVTVRDTSQPAVSASASPATICAGKSSTLSISGGKLGTGANWEWYSSSCSGTPVASGSSISVTPSKTTTYFVRAEGTCNSTICRSVVVTVNDTSVPTVSVTATSTSICRAQNTTLSVNGGSLGTGATWKWYSGSCGGTSVGSGSSLTVSPLTTTTYYVRAEGTCNNTICRSIIITVRDTSVAATSISGSNTACKGQSVTWSVSGGTLGTGASWKWYSGSCGGTPVATGSSYTTSHASAGTYTYYVRAEGTCNNTICRSITVTVRDTSTPALFISGTTPICQGQTSTMSVIGGTLGTGASWKWYTGSCGGTNVATGSTYSVSPSTGGTYVYYVRAEGNCNNTVCQTFTLVVRDTSAPAISASATTPICKGQSSTLTVNGGKLGTGASWKWYLGSCFGSLEGTGSSISVSPASAGTYTYYVKAEGTCNSTPCKSVTVTVRDTSVPASSIVSSVSTLCKGQSVTMTLTGGSLGFNAGWKWYEGNCGGTLVGTGTSITLKPSAGSKAYYVRAEGTCNNSACIVQNITVNDTSEPAAAINATLTTVCAGSTTILSVSGGHLGTAANWKWYLGSCGGTPVATGSSFNLIPAIGGDYTYYVRAEGTCNTTRCTSIKIKVLDVSVVGGISGSSEICLGATNTLKVNGGALGTGATWKWYTGSCGGTVAGTGNILNVSPPSSGTYTYFVRGEGTCNNTACASYTFVVRDTTIPAAGIAGPTAVCPGNTPITWKRVGGVLGYGAQWHWFRVACDRGTGVWLGQGDSISFTANQLGIGTHYIYLTTERGCNKAKCATLVLTIRSLSSTPSIQVQKSTICEGDSTTISVTGGSLGTGATWNWYSGSCGGTILGTGSSIVVKPTDTTQYFVRAEGPCDVSSCATVKVNVTHTPASPVSITSNYTDVCPGTNVKLYAQGPAKLPGEQYKWYIDNGGTLTPIGMGDSISINISSTSNIIVRSENACFNSVAASKTINVYSYPSGTWVGIKNSDWNEKDNWCGGIPTASTDVVISSGTPYQPVISALARVRNLTLNAGASLDVNSSGSLEFNGSFTKSGNFTSSGLVAFRSGGAVTTDGFATRDLEVNLVGEVTLNSNINVSGNLLLGKGSVVTGNNEVNVTNDNANAVKNIAGNAYFKNGWIAGNLRRSIKTVDSTYHFPVGSIAEGNNAEFVNHNVSGVTSILASIKPKAGNDIGLNLKEGTTPYVSVSNGGVWYLEPNGSITSGNFDLRLWFHGQATFTTGLRDNNYSILNRSVSSAVGSDWLLPPTNSTYVINTVASGNAVRNGINAMGQFGIGITENPVKVSALAINARVNILPNPFNAEFAVNMNIPNAAQVTVNVYDQAGRLVVQQNAGKLTGNNTLKVNAGNLSEGTYTVVVKGDGQTLHTEKMVKILK